MGCHVACMLSYMYLVSMAMLVLLGAVGLI